MLSALGPTNSCPLTNDQLWVSPGHSVCKCPLIIPRRTLKGLPWWLSGKEPTYQGRRCGFDPWSGRYPEEGNGNPLQYSCLEIPWTEESGWLQSMGLQRVRHGLASKQQQQEGFKRGDSSEVVCEALISSSSFLPSQERNSEFFNF